MAKQTANSKEIRRTIRLKFLTERGKIHTISLNCASARLAGAEGPALVKGVAERILEYDIFTVKLVKFIGAELTERRVILASGDFQIDGVRAKRENASVPRKAEIAGKAMLQKASAVARGVGKLPDADCADALKVSAVVPRQHMRTIQGFQAIGETRSVHIHMACSDLLCRFNPPGRGFSLYFGRSQPPPPLSARPSSPRRCP